MTSTFMSHTLSEHVGTTDLDIVVGIALESEEDEAYRTLQQNLKDAQFAPRRNPDTNQEETFRWTREVDGVSVVLEFFCPVGEGNAGQLLRNPGKNVGSKVSAMRIRGAELAGRDHITINLGGELLDHGGIQERIEVRVCNLLPLLVLKSFALDERDKSKDSYDLVWILNAFQKGPASVVTAPRLIAALGSQRDRYESAYQIQCYSGIAPVVSSSGKKHHVHCRWACPAFLRQTFHEWAQHSMISSQWAREYYEHQRKAGKGHNTAVRALAFKWIRILFRCWKNNVVYSELIYTKAAAIKNLQPKSGTPVEIKWETKMGMSKIMGLAT